MSVSFPLLHSSLKFGISEQAKKNLLRARLAEGYVDNICNAIRVGADINLRDEGGNTPLMQFVKDYSYETVVNFLDRFTENPSFKQKIDLNAQNDNGETALMIAVQKGNLPTVELLLKKGANPTLTNCFGKTALKIAQDCGHYFLLDLLQNAGTK